MDTIVERPGALDVRIGTTDPGVLADLASWAGQCPGNDRPPASNAAGALEDRAG